MMGVGAGAVSEEKGRAALCTQPARPCHHVTALAMEAPSHARTHARTLSLYEPLLDLETSTMPKAPLGLAPMVGSEPVAALPCASEGRVSQGVRRSDQVSRHAGQRP